ncbi:MAG: penicillin-binding protein, partial [Actinobacteria bacterium]|nr:penicillin-binding protein [Actinomycetota bacterium]
MKNIYVEPAKGGPWGKSYSTVRDLYRFYDAMMNGRIIEGEAN